MSNRCAICDYHTTIPSLSLLSAPLRRVKWSKRHNEYICSECSNKIRETNFKFTNNNFNEDIMNDIAEAAETQEQFSIPPDESPLS